MMKYILPAALAAALLALGPAMQGAASPEPAADVQSNAGELPATGNVSCYDNATTARLPVTTSTRANGSCPLYLRNATAGVIYVTVDNTGRGVRCDKIMNDGRCAQRLEPNEVACANQCSYGDCPKIYVYNPQGQLIAGDMVVLSPIFGNSRFRKYAGGPRPEADN